LHPIITEILCVPHAITWHASMQRACTGAQHACIRHDCTRPARPREQAHCTHAPSTPAPGIRAHTRTQPSRTSRLRKQRARKGAACTPQTTRKNKLTHAHSTHVRSAHRRAGLPLTLSGKAQKERRPERPLRLRSVRGGLGRPPQQLGIIPSRCYLVRAMRRTRTEDFALARAAGDGPAAGPRRQPAPA
jgi:hypothetical protein